MEIFQWPSLMLTHTGIKFSDKNFIFLSIRQEWKYALSFSNLYPFTNFRNTVDILVMNENSQIMTMIGTNYDHYFTQWGQSQYEVAF
jgi:hypothetical protein